MIQTIFFLFFHCCSYSQHFLDCLPGRRFQTQNIAGTGRKLGEKSPYSEGKNEKSLKDGCSIPARKFSDFFRWLSALSGFFPQETVGSYRKSSKICGQEYYFHGTPEVLGTGRFLARFSDLGCSNKEQCTYYEQIQLSLNYR